MIGLDSEQQFVALIILDYVSDLFTASPHGSFSRIEILKLLNDVMNDPDLIDSQALIAYQEATADISNGEES